MNFSTQDSLNSLESRDENVLAAGLKELIAQTYVIENEYKNLKNSYDEMLHIVREVFEQLPSAVWVLDSGAVLMQNEAASAGLLRAINEQPSEDFELSYEGADYLVRRNKFAEKQLIIATNITTQKRAQRLQNMGQIAAQLAHEIRNPIGSVMLMASALRRRAQGSESELLEQMCEAINRVEVIVKNTLQFSRGIKLEKKKFSAKCLADAAARILDPSTCEIEVENIELFGDEGLLLQALSNLLYNAQEAGERVKLRARLLAGAAKSKAGDGASAVAGGASGAASAASAGAAGGGVYEICVMDDGEEVSASVQAALFEAFYTTKLRGTGLGLALAQQIAEAHGGRIYYRSQPEKAFVIELPLEN